MSVHRLPDYLEATAARCPDRVAVVEPAGRTATYAELNRQSDHLAGFLAGRGVGRGDRVGVVLPKSIEALVTLFGIMKAGAAYVPVDAGAPVERSRRILDDCAVRALVVDSRMLGVVPACASTTPALAALIVVGPVSDAGSVRTDAVAFASALESGERPEGVENSADDLAYIIYTSGSTGTPKGAMITHRNARSFVDWCTSVLEPTDEDRFSSHTPFHFDASVQDIYVAIKHGATLYLIPEELGKSPEELVRFIVERRLTVWTSTPSALVMLVQFGNLGAHGDWSPRVVSFGGEVFPAKHLRELKRRWPRPVYYNMYGPTETSTTCTFARIPDVVPEDRDTPYPIGFPCGHCEALVLDESGRDVPAGEEGLLHISGPSVFAGYWNRPTETAAVFLERSGIRWYNTGDVVRWDPDEGFTYVGRRDRMVKRRGYRIELGEIERALYQHPQVSEAAVVSVPDPDAGVKIVAFVACRGTESPSIIEMKTFCASRLPTYMSPDRFVFQERLPRTSTDKTDYQSLRAQL